MRRTRGGVVDVDSLDDFDRRLAYGLHSLSGWRLRDIDLTARRKALRSVDVAGALFLGCDLLLEDEESIRARGAVVFPSVPDAPIDAYRTTLYTPHELFASDGYLRSPDARIYGWSQRDSTRDAMLAQSLHDHSIGIALETWVRGRTLVGVMGGHSAARGERTYTDGAMLGRMLSQTHAVATGGGPGAMEAVNLGGYLATYGDDAVDEAVHMLAAVPSFAPSVGAWADAAFAVRDRFPQGADSLGIPTWHYGHEPPNPFASAIAKYFHNAQREAILLEVCQGGIIFLPGAGGTVQEIFQDACENYYADESSIAPMVLVGRDYWTQQLPAWPLLQALAKGRPMEQHVHLVDTVQEAAALVSKP
ncbi:LOG family protein [Microbacterium sp. H1-D42]|uniref:LOG family protein n=1 Tax=Microbacterium sp. H1-D42 TaxID=2925844 RepID=UPI001F531FC5|nr:LOG family protein [Microbacterium sp. H1-D42]UNK69500.1 LOG family protein [Microbacterium sp. H1-D42]